MKEQNREQGYYVCNESDAPVVWKARLRRSEGRIPNRKGVYGMRRILRRLGQSRIEQPKPKRKINRSWRIQWAGGAGQVQSTR